MAAESRTMDIWAHIDELRNRLKVVLIALAATTVLSFIFAERLIDLLAAPIGGTETLQSIEVTENISVFMKVSLLSGFILASPVIFYELFAFILPGLEKNEKRWVYLAIPTAVIFFLAGAFISYRVLLPNGLKVLLTWMDIKTVPRPESYFNFVTTLIFWVGIAFETPLLVFVLARLRFLSARDLIRQWRIALIVIAVAAAVITPTGDMVNMALLMLPLFILYLISILFAAIARRGEKA